MNTAVKPASFKADKKDERKLSMRAIREAGNSVDLTLSNVKAHREGLTASDAAERLIKDGPNEVAHERRLPALLQLLLAFKNPFIMVLMALAAISAFTDILWCVRRVLAAEIPFILKCCAM